MYRRGPLFTEVPRSESLGIVQNGNIEGTLRLSPPGLGSFTCPPGQDLVGPTNVSYSNVTLTDTTSGQQVLFGTVR